LERTRKQKKPEAAGSVVVVIVIIAALVGVRVLCVVKLRATENQQKHELKIDTLRAGRLFGDISSRVFCVYVRPCIM
jgi:heme/copper-type cytochrome/quinol oxidase subunit 2